MNGELETGIRALFDHINDQNNEIERLRTALKPFAAYGSLIAECGNKGVQITTLVYSERRVSEDGEAVWEGQPIAADDWLFGILIADRAVPAAMAVPVITARYFYEANAAMKGGKS